MNRLQKYAVTLQDGERIIAFVHVVTTNGILIVDLYHRAHRLLDSSCQPYHTDKPNTHMTAGLHKFIGRYVNPAKIEPMGQPVDKATLPYALKKSGTWWERVIVPYIVLGEE